MLCQYYPISGSTLPYGSCKKPELVFRSGCLQTALNFVSAEFKIPVVKAPAHLLICINNVREYGIHEDDWDYHQDFLPQEQFWRHGNAGKGPEVEPDATNLQGLDSSPPFQVTRVTSSHKTKQRQHGSQEKVHSSRKRFWYRGFEKLHGGITSLELA